MNPHDQNVGLVMLDERQAKIVHEKHIDILLGVLAIVFLIIAIHPH